LKASKVKRKDHKQDAPSQVLKGWQQIAAFLGQSTTVVHRWASEGMPVHREGRFVTTTPAEINEWLGRESGKPVQVATENTDLTAELKRGLSFVRRGKPSESTSGKRAKKA
jgi:hypothetical protein